MIVVVGDALLDLDVVGDVERLCPDAPVPVLDVCAELERPGGAALAAVLARRAEPDRDVVLVCRLGADDPALRLARLLGAFGVEVVALTPAAPTAVEQRLRAGGQSLLRVDHGGAAGRAVAPAEGSDDAAPLERALAAIGSASGVLVADYGRGVAATPALRQALARLPARRPLVWDPHPRGAEPVPGARLLTPNERELDGLQPGGAGLAAQSRRCRALAARLRAGGVALTCGARGALLVEDSLPLAVPATPVAGGDPCGSGDCFAATLTARLAAGALASEAVREAVAAAGSFVAAGGAAALALAAGPGPNGGLLLGGGSGDPFEVARRTRLRGGAVVAAGGCFDVLHAGHVSMLEHARSLGDCLVVCMNSDASVRRLKGERRPVVAEAERAAMLRSLRAVDAVAVFDEDTPAELLRRLRPDVFVKGGDYLAATTPESEVLETLGSVALTVPFLPGHSTTSLLARLLPEP